mmetsp:Transcript_5078/g.10651  ORF Transcript_5078/g.10651 Transcript_5078/m.10651 type:complete len:285 (-) Transcript_5078:1890-2744(-)
MAKKSRFCWILVLAAWATTVALLATQTHADSLEDEYVREVVEEDRQHYNDYYGEEDGDAHNNNNDDDEEARDDYVDEEQRRRDEEERAAREAADRIAAERERKFEAELEKITDEEQKKAAMKQKQQDGKRVRSVLKAAQRNDLYQVLGIRNWNLKIPPREVAIGGMIKFTIPGVTLKETTDKQIRKQFRTRARQIHPDKNKDGRAEEAFIAVENAASILSDKGKRKEYDDYMKAYRSERLETHRRLVATSVASAVAVTRRVVKVIQTILGPFFVPVLIIAALII